MKTKRNLGDYVRIGAYCLLSSIPVISSTGCANIKVNRFPVKGHQQTILYNVLQDQIELTEADYTSTPQRKPIKEDKNGIIGSYTIGGIALAIIAGLWGYETDRRRKARHEKRHRIFPLTGGGGPGTGGPGGN